MVGETNRNYEVHSSLAKLVRRSPISATPTSHNSNVKRNHTMKNYLYQDCLTAYMSNGNHQKEDPIAKAFYLIIGIYIIFHVIKALVAADPSFASIGWQLLGGIVFGAVMLFRKKLFN